MKKIIIMIPVQNDIADLQVPVCKRIVRWRSRCDWGRSIILPRLRYMVSGSRKDYPNFAPQWGTADAEIKVPSGENTELKRYPFKAWSRSVYSHTCYAYWQGFLPCLLLPFRSIHLHFLRNPSRFLLCWLWLTHGSCVGPQNEIGHPAGCRFLCWVPAEYK